MIQYHLEFSFNILQNLIEHPLFFRKERKRKAFLLVTGSMNLQPVFYKEIHICDTNILACFETLFKYITFSKNIAYNGSSESASSVNWHSIISRAGVL